MFKGDAPYWYIGFLNKSVWDFQRLPGLNCQELEMAYDLSFRKQYKSITVNLYKHKTYISR